MSQSLIGSGRPPKPEPEKKPSEQELWEDANEEPLGDHLDLHGMCLWCGSPDVKGHKCGPGVISR